MISQIDPVEMHNNHSQTRQTLQKLLAEDKIQQYIKLAEEYPWETTQYVGLIRKEYKLSKYWEGVLFALLHHKKILPDVLAGAATVKKENDTTLNQPFFAIEIYPETSATDARRAFSRIKEDYRKMGLTSRREKKSDRLTIELHALQLKKSGLSSKEIAKALTVEYKKIFIASEVLNLLKKARDKAKF